MLFFAAVAEQSWLATLTRLDPRPDQIALCRPGGGPLRAVPEGAPVLFVVGNPGAVGEGGTSAGHVAVPASVAWWRFGATCGAPDREMFLVDVAGRRGIWEEDATIGCTVVAAQSFFDADEWVPVPELVPHTHVGRVYDTDSPEARGRCESAFGGVGPPF